MWKFLAKLSVVSAIVLVVAWFIKGATKKEYAHRNIFNEEDPGTENEPVGDELVPCEDFFAEA